MDAICILFRIVVRHDYYNDAAGRCADLDIVPTAACAAMMRRLGIRATMIAGDLVVTVPAARLAGLRDRVARDGGRTMLSFTLTPATPDFLAITALPIGFDPSRCRIHLDNRATAMAGSGPALLGGADGITAAMLYPTTGATLAVPSPTTGGVVLTDRAGSIVVAGRTVGATTVFDLSAMAAGLYRIAVVDAVGVPVATPSDYPAPTAYLYAPAAPRAIGLLDLILAQPEAGVGDPLSYPLSDDGIKTVSLALRFAARETYWHYYVVDPHGTLDEDLAITGPGARFARTSTVLPNGQRAALFAADTALPLARYAAQRFRLTGQSHAADGTRRRIGIARLPAPPPRSPVWPLVPDDPVAARSDIHVYV